MEAPPLTPEEIAINCSLEIQDLLRENQVFDFVLTNILQPREFEIIYNVFKNSYSLNVTFEDLKACETLVNYKTSIGQNLLLIYLNCAKPPLKSVVEWLIESKSDLTITTKFGQTIMDTALNNKTLAA